MLMVLSSWQSHCEGSSGLFDKCRTASSGRRPKTRPNPPVHAARVYTHHRHLLLLLSPKADTHFTVPRRVEGWVDLVGWLHTEMVYPQTVTHPGTNRVWRSATTLIEANALPLSQTANWGLNSPTPPSTMPMIAKVSTGYCLCSLLSTVTLLL